MFLKRTFSFSQWFGGGLIVRCMLLQLFDHLSSAFVSTESHLLAGVNKKK